MAGRESRISGTILGRFLGISNPCALWGTEMRRDERPVAIGREGDRDDVPVASTARSNDSQGRDLDGGDPPANGPPDNDPPDWSMVPFAVACPRCGCDVHGRSEPVCPDCALSLDWSVLAPVEELTCPKCRYHLYGLTAQRCPECGDEFSWDDVVDGFRRLRKPLFEFHWRQAPLRWFIRALSLAFRPWKLWRTIDICDPTAIAGLAILAAFALLLSVIVPLLLVYPTHWLVDWLTGMISTPKPWMRWRYAPWSSAWALGYVFKRVLIGLSFSLVWLFGAFGGLMVLRQSMASCRVRNGHVFRVCVYSLVPLFCCSAIAFTTSAAIDTTLSILFVGARFRFKEEIARTLFLANHSFGWPILVLVLVAIGTLSMAMAYRRYIRMRHSWAVALSAQAIATLTALIVYLRVMHLF